MPSTGTPARSASGSTCGAPGSLTLAGPPLRMSPAGSSCFSSDHGVVPGTSSQYTLASRTRRAISWLNCDPKSRTRTVCWRTAGVVSFRGRAAAAVRLSSALPHAHVLRLLERLALGRDRRSDDHLHVLELGDVVRAADAERRPKGAREILAAVVDAGRAEQDLFQRGLRAHVDSCAAREVGIVRRHAPVVALGRRLLGAGERRPDHDGVCARRERLADVSTDAHATVRDDGDPHATPAHVLIARSRDVGGGGDLWDTHAQDAARGACGTWADPDEDARDARFHELQRGLVVNAVADDHRDFAIAHELFERKLVIGP